MARRFFVKNTNIKNDKLQIIGDEHQHLTKVLRAKIKDTLTVSTEDFEYECEIESIEKDKTICAILSKEKICDDAPNVTLFQASMKGEHMEYSIQKATELNIKTFVPFLSQFVVAKIDSKKTERFQRISQEACKQSNRKRPMQILDVVNFDEMIKMLKGYNKILFAYENSTRPAKEEILSLEEKDSVALIVGAEGGFSEKEAQKLVENGAMEISLGKNILRGETAGLVLSSAVMLALNQFKRI